MRADIQSLRALAVMLVLMFHVWPDLIPGGYIGVDVFFVISGFLITGLLIREVESNGRIRFLRFYVRRAARLLPASLLVLATVLALTVIMQPGLLWRETAHEVTAAALYVENWYLHFQSLDYLAGDAARSPVQHFWSLGVEEQFYLFWPIAVTGGAFLATGLCARWRKITGIRLVLGIIVAASLVWSIYAGTSGAGPEYFSTVTRTWQLGLGGLLATSRCQLGRWALPAGLVGVLGSAWLLNAESVYPGWLALLPTLSTVLMLAGGQYWNQDGMLRWQGGRAVQFLGDCSYSLYLWHWPMIAFAYVLWPTPRGWLGGGLLILASIALAGLTKRFVEDRFRIGHKQTVSVTWTMGGVAAFSMVVLVASLSLPLMAVNPLQAMPNEHFPGAGVLDGAPWGADDTRFVPALDAVGKDIADAYAEDCHQESQTDPAVKKCVYGADQAQVKIAIIGDSHAVHWHPAFQELIKPYDLQMIGMSKSACAFSAIVTYNSAQKHNYDSCLQWSHNVVDELRKMTDLDAIIVSESPGHSLGKGIEVTEGSPRAQVGLGMAQMWDLAEQVTGKPVIVMHPTVFQPTVVWQCAAAQAWPFDECTRKSAGAFKDKPIILGAKISGRKMLDLSRYFCFDGRCPAVIGGVFVYRDRHHVTKTYMKTMAPALRDGLEEFGIRLERRQ